MERREWINSVIPGVDELLLRDGYTRRKSDQEWKRTHASGDLERIHFNFGLGVINPSLSVDYVDLKTVLPDTVGAKTSTFRMLSHISGVFYDESTPCELLRDHLRHFAAPELERLLDREWVISKLLPVDARDWPALCYSTKIRLLPLLMVSVGRLNEARDLVEAFASDKTKPDQFRPEYEVFRQHFLARFERAR